MHVDLQKMSVSTELTHFCTQTKDINLDKILFLIYEINLMIMIHHR